ncbi:hypothetical protein OAB48_00150 [Pelagibacteraceae bacterium]|nr:hypothetical protein [Pelagibacteraceae bacterium]
MKLLSLNNFCRIIFAIIILTNSTYADDTIDIWKKKVNLENSQQANENSPKKNKLNKIFKSKKTSQDIEINSEISENTIETKLYGIHDPDDYNFNLTMWTRSDGSGISSTIKRINKLKLSKTAENIFLNTILSYSYPPKNISEKEFLNLKISWMVENKKDDLLEKFLEKNNNFYNKKKIIQYLVDKNIAKANLKEGCEKANFIGKEIKDSYLEKFKIYCLIYNNKKNQAQLLYDILKEQKKSDTFFNNKINFLLGISEKTDKKIKDDSLLNLYLSSITVPNFKYEPTKKTSKAIWEYLNAANLIKLEDIENKEKIIKLEIAANDNRYNKSNIFEIYKRIPFNLNTLINAENTYKSFGNIDSRALIYQKYLLSDNLENKLKLLFILKDLFVKDKLPNVYAKFLSDRLKEFDKEKIPKSYLEVVERNTISDIEMKFGKIKYNDKILHKSRVIRQYTESDTPIKKTQKDLENVYKKIKRNKKYFFSAKDLSLIESLKVDGITIPKDLDIDKISKKYQVPSNLLQLVKNQESGFLSLKIVEIIGEDEVVDLDPETIYFITHLLNQLNLVKFRNEILISALPLRT